jgi:outer membrane protein W
MLRSISKFLFSLLLVAGLATVTLAQDDIIRPITKSGSMAFVFNMSGFGTFGLSPMAIGTAGSTTVQGAGVKWYVTDEGAVRILLAMNMQDNGVDKADGQSVSSTTIGIGAQYEHHFPPLYSTSPYIGGGVAFSSSSTKTATSSAESTSGNTQLHVGVVAGFDWFFTRGLALGAEYRLGFTSNGSSIDPEPTGYKSVSPTSIGIGGGASVHFLAYF